MLSTNIKNIISIIGLLIVAVSAIEDHVANESSKPTIMEDNQLVRRRKTKSAKSSDSGGGLPFIEDTPDDDASSMSMSMPGGADDPFIGLADSDATDVDSGDIDSTEEESVTAVIGDTKDGATTDQWHALVSTLDATHESYTTPDESEEADETDSMPSKVEDSPWHNLLSTLGATHESYTPPESGVGIDGEDTAASEEEDMSMSSTTASSMSMSPGDGRDESESDGGSDSSKARKLSTAAADTATASIHGRMTKIGLARMRMKMDDELPWGHSDHSMKSMSMPNHTSEADIDTVAANTEEPMINNMPDSKSSKAKSWKTKSAKAKSSKADHHVMSMPNSKSGKAKSGKRL